MKMKYVFYPFIIFALMSCTSEKIPVKTVSEVNLERYAGKWYDIAHLPARFMTGCECTTAEYGITGKNYVTVKNSCRKSGKWTSITGKAFTVSGTGNARLKVQFFWPLKGDYRILALDENYQYALVGTNNRKYLWILSRTPHLSKPVYDMLVSDAARQGFPVETLVITNQDCSEPQGK